MPRKFWQFLEELAREKAPGPAPSFTVFHLLFALERIEGKSVGRNRLAQEMSVGEGVARTIIKRLMDAGLVETSRAGCSLTDKGLTLVKEYRSTIKKTTISESSLTFGDHNIAILVKNGGRKVKSGMEQRDAAVMSGAKGATTVVFRNGRLIFPSSEREISADSSQASNEITRLLKPSENDAVIIVSADSPRKAEYAALAAAWTLVDDV
jgi:predicted transcriptional regulator